MAAERPSLLMLRSIRFFQGLEEQELQEIADSMWIGNYRRGEDLAGRRQEHLREYWETAYFVYRGVVSVYTVTRRGGRKILFFQGPGELLNQNVMGAGGNQLLGEAVTDAILLCMGRAELARWVLRLPDLTQALFAHYETKLWRLGHQLKNTADRWFVERKLAAKLLKLAGDFGSPQGAGAVIDFDLTVKQMADYVGAPRETVSRACGRLTEMGLIRYERRRFCIPDLERLEQFRRQI